MQRTVQRVARLTWHAQVPASREHFDDLLDAWHAAPGRANHATAALPTLQLPRQTSVSTVASLAALSSERLAERDFYRPASRFPLSHPDSRRKARRAQPAVRGSALDVFSFLFTITRSVTYLIPLHGAEDAPLCPGDITYLSLNHITIHHPIQIPVPDPLRVSAYTLRNCDPAPHWKTFILHSTNP